MRWSLVILIAHVFSFTLPVLGAAETSPPPEAQTVMDRFVADGAKAVTEAEAKRTAVRAKLDAALDAVQVAEGKAGRLESALAVKQLRADLAAGTTPAPAAPANPLPKAVARPMETCQSDIAKIDKESGAKINTLRDQAVKDLEAVKVAQTKAGHLDAALAVKQMQEQLRGGLTTTARQAPAAALVFTTSSRIEPTDDALLRRGGTESTIEIVLTALTGDGLIFHCGAGGNGQSIAIVGDELVYAVVGSRNHALIKAPLGGAKPPLHLAVTFAKGDVTLWLNGTLLKHESSGLDTLGDNGMGGSLGDLGGNGGQPGMPRTGFSGDVAIFRYVDKVIYTAPFKPTFPLPATDSIRWQIEAQGLAAGPLKDLPKNHISGELTVKIR